MNRTQLALAVYVPTFLLAFGQGVVLPMTPLYAREFTPSVGLVSLAVAALALGTMLADVPAGVILERIGRRPMMLLGTGLVAAAMLGLSVAHLYWELVAYQIAAGVGFAFWSISRLAFMTDVLPSVSRGRGLATYGGVNRIGVFAGPACGGLIAEAFGLNVPFVLAAGMAVGALAISALWVPETRPERSLGHRARWGVLGGVLRRHWPDFTGAGAAQVFAQMIRAGRQLIVPLYGATVLGLDVAAVGTIVSVSALIDMSLFYPAGMLMDRLGRKYASIPSFLVMGLGMALLPLVGGFLGLLLVTAVIGLGNGLGSGTMMTLGADLAPRQAAGEFLGLWRLVGDAGAMAGPLVVGAVADLVGLRPAALVLAGVGALAAATIYLFVTETLRAEGEAEMATSAPSG